MWLLLINFYQDLNQIYASPIIHNFNTEYNNFWQAKNDLKLKKKSELNHVLLN